MNSRLHGVRPLRILAGLVLEKRHRMTKRHHHTQGVPMFARNLGLALLLLGILGPSAKASTLSDLESAAKHQKTAFILVTDKGATGIDQARRVIRQAMKQVERSTLVELDRSDPANASLVAKYRLAGAPVPLVLLAARNGVLAGGLPADQATPELLVGMVPSPKKADILRALHGGKSAFITLSRRGMTSQPSAQAACALACSQMNNKSVAIQVDMDDPDEAGFLKQLKVDLAATEPITLVVNAQGQVTGTYAGAVDVANLVQAATKRASGCCPSTVQGGGKSCAPTK